MLRDVHTLVGVTEESNGPEVPTIGQENCRRTAATVTATSSAPRRHGRRAVPADERRDRRPSGVRRPGGEVRRCPAGLTDPPDRSGAPLLTARRRHHVRRRIRLRDGVRGEVLHVAAILLTGTNENDLLTRGDDTTWIDETVEMFDGVVAFDARRVAASVRAKVSEDVPGRARSNQHGQNVCLLPGRSCKPPRRIPKLRCNQHVQSEYP